MPAAVTALRPARRRLPIEMIGGWEVGLIVFLILLYLVGVYINPRFFGSAAALSSVMRDAARYGVMAVGMTFVIVNKDLDLSVGSLYGLTAAVFCGVLRALLFQHRPLRGDRLDTGRRPVRRAHQRRARHHPARSGVHRHADHAVHRPRHCHRRVRRQDHLLPGQGQGVSRVLLPRREERLGLQQPGFHLRGLCRRRHGPARKDHRRLPDLRDRRQRARFRLCRHPDALGAHARLSDIGVLRHHRRHDAGRSGSRPHRPVGPGPRVDRHRRGHRRRRFDPRRPWPRPRQHAGRHPHRAGRQGPARRLPDDPHRAWSTTSK